MPKSTITVRHQTTVPKEVREKLGVGPNDVLQWEIEGDHATVTPSDSALLDFQRHSKTRKLPPGAGAFDSGYTDTAERAEEVLGELGFGKDRP
ncbi:MAG TPA: AbrB/MazE/SpoVT family DNA-binding domain-containing protein [Thermoanaerobaculia bacterium]|jgi:AbrB family looped-hinge helix DNA binding protein|nr:AbrB/MazE/SpoVT family DNA-binding domain-containing protein [Thermoanaerobaculia bacterium]